MVQISIKDWLNGPSCSKAFIVRICTPHGVFSSSFEHSVLSRPTLHRNLCPSAAAPFTFFDVPVDWKRWRALDCPTPLSSTSGLLHFTPLLFPQPNDSSASICLPEALIQDLSDRRMYPSPSPCSEAPASSPFQRNYNALPSADSPALFESEYSPCEEVAMLTLCAKENLLKSTSGFRHQKPRSSSTATNPYEENLANEGSYRGGKSRSRSGKQSKWSPTASMRRAKAEHLLKAHGSPPGIRVTAGGRIVSQIFHIHFLICETVLIDAFPRFLMDCRHSQALAMISLSNPDLLSRAHSLTVLRPSHPHITLQTGRLYQLVMACLVSL